MGNLRSFKRSVQLHRNPNTKTQRKTKRKVKTITRAAARGESWAVRLLNKLNPFSNNEQ